MVGSTVNRFVDPRIASAGMSHGDLYPESAPPPAQPVIKTGLLGRCTRLINRMSDAATALKTTIQNNPRCATLLGAFLGLGAVATLPYAPMVSVSLGAGSLATLCAAHPKTAKSVSQVLARLVVVLLTAATGGRSFSSTRSGALLSI